MVGVQLQESTIPGPGASTVIPGAGYCIVCETLRGNPNLPVLITSMQQYEQIFGPRVTWGFGYDDLSAYFGEAAGSGAFAWVSRIVGPSDTTGSLTLADNASVSTLQLFGGCPSIDPVTGNNLGNVEDPGAWSSNLSVQSANSLLSGQFVLTVFYNGVLVETWGPFTSVAAAVTKINSNSAYLYAVNLFSSSSGATANPAPTTNPRVDTATVTNASDSVLDASVLATDYGLSVTGTGIPSSTYVGTVTAATSFLLSSTSGSQSNVNATSNGTSVTVHVPGPVALSAGNDERGTITSAMAAAQLSVFPPAVVGGLAAATPGWDASLTGSALQTWANTNGVLGLLYPTEGMSETTVAAAAANFRGGDTGPQTSGYFWPWVVIPDGSGGTRLVPPTGAVAGRRAATIAGTGPWQPPAGNWGVMRFVLGLDPASSPVTDAIGDYLDSQCVSVIRPKQGIRLYGWRSLSTDTQNYALLNQADVLNNVAAQLYAAFQQFVFAGIDSLGHLGTAMQTAALQVLAPYINAGAFWPGPLGSNGQPTDPGYLLDTGSDVNTPTTIANNEYGMAVYIRPIGAAALIPLTVIKTAIGSAF